MFRHQNVSVQEKITIWVKANILMTNLPQFGYVHSEAWMYQ